MLPTGGVNAATGTSTWRPARRAGIGSELVDATALAAGKLDVITARAKEWSRRVAAARAR